MAETAELAVVAPETRVLPLEGLTKRHVMHLLDMGGGLEPPAEVEAAVVSAAALVAADDEPGDGDVLVVDRIDRAELDKWWATIEARRRFRLAPVSRLPRRLPEKDEDGLGAMKGRLERAEIWNDMARGGARYDEIAEISLKKYPKAYACTRCTRWYLDADTKICPGCSGQLEVRDTSDLLGPEPSKKIRNDVKWFRGNTDRLPKPSAHPDG